MLENIRLNDMPRRSVAVSFADSCAEKCCGPVTRKVNLIVPLALGLTDNKSNMTHKEHAKINGYRQAKILHDRQDLGHQYVLGQTFT